MPYLWPYSCIQCSKKSHCFVLRFSSPRYFARRCRAVLSRNGFRLDAAFAQRRRKGNATSIRGEKCFTLLCCNSALPRENTAQMRRRRGEKCPRSEIRFALRGAKSLRIKRPRIDRRRATPERAVR